MDKQNRLPEFGVSLDDLIEDIKIEEERLLSLVKEDKQDKLNKFRFMEKLE